MRISKNVTALAAGALAALAVTTAPAYAWESNNHSWGEGKETRRFFDHHGPAWQLINLDGCSTNSGGFKSAKIAQRNDVSMAPDPLLDRFTNKCNTHTSHFALSRDDTWYYVLEKLDNGSTLKIKKLTVISGR
ncbi:hypothetical protein AB0C96_24275 [Streptomyces sp. NPDC048506]|uniref:hypothetical protein n=1 Tax=Streptomyces sp. NPDC048506 TaxID=3155028 RepID=UPI003425CDED